MRSKIYPYITILILLLITGCFFIFYEQYTFFDDNENIVSAENAKNQHYGLALYLNESMKGSGVETLPYDGIGEYQSPTGKKTSNYGTLSVEIVYVSGDDRYKISNSGSQQASVGVNFKSSTIGLDFTIVWGDYTTNYKVKVTATPANGFRVYTGMAWLTGYDFLDFSEGVPLSAALWSTSSQSYTIDNQSLTLSNGDSGKNEEFLHFFYFAPCPYNITYKVDNKDYKQLSTDYLNYYNLPTEPAKIGYKFLGWYTKESGGTKITSSTVKESVGDETLYAQWEKLPYKVDINILNPNGEQDKISGTMSQTYNGTTKDNLNDQYFSTMYINETMKISNIVPALGYKLVDVVSNIGTITNNQDGTYTFTANFTKNPLGNDQWDAVIEIKMDYESYTLSVDPGGGIYNGNSDIKTFTQQYTSTIDIAVPTREGYEFAGWVIYGGYGTLASYGKVNSLYADQFFKEGENGTGIYNNAGNGNVTHTYLSIPYDYAYFPEGSKILQISNKGYSYPGLGGFTNYLQSYENAVFYSVIYAKIPKGYSLIPAFNQYGNGSSNEWLTANVGTGEWETYVLKWNCGSGGSFSSINFFYISGTQGTSANPVNWQVGYFGTYDATNLTTAGQIVNGNTQFTYGTGDVTLVALWTKKDVALTINTDGGYYEGQSNPILNVQYKELIGLTTPTKTGYAFNGWQLDEGNISIESNNYLSIEKDFDGVNDFIAIGRNLMYTDKITIAFSAYMSNWAEYSSKNMRLISCTETGGWNFETSSGNIVFAIYDKGYGYKSISTTKAWSSLSAGWHSFVATFDGEKASLFVDNVLLGCSAQFNSGLIGYNSSNGIFIGAEAGSSATSPVGNYFDGQIKNLVILNESITSPEINYNNSSYVISQDSNAIIKALWEETWINHISDDFESENGWYLINNANDLARLAYLFNHTERTDIFNMKFKLTANIDLSNYYWEPIGTKNRPFSAQFDGAGYIISGLKTLYSTTTSQTSIYVGLFGYTSGAIIKNIKLDNSSIKGYSNVGGIIGYSYNSTISNNLVFDSIIEGTENIGGIVGVLSGGTLITCGLEAEIKGVNNFGAIIGNISSGTISDCYAIANIENNQLYGIKNGTINNCVAIFNVGTTSNKVYLGNDFSNFVWINTSSCPIPKNLVFMGEIVGNVTIEGLNQAGFAKIY